MPCGPSRSPREAGTGSLRMAAELGATLTEALLQDVGDIPAGPTNLVLCDSPDGDDPAFQRVLDLADETWVRGGSVEVD